MLIHQSDLSALARCAAQYGYKRAGLPTKTNSRTAYGSVMHHALEVFERARATGTVHHLAVHQSLETFVHYWHPSNIDAICDPVPADGWLVRDNFADMRSRGLDVIRKYTELVKFDEAVVLGTEFGFMVPIAGTWDDDLGEPHYLGGSVDRLVQRHYNRKLAVGIDDFKTGVVPKYLRHNLQGTAYAYASTTPEFWTGHRGEDGFGPERGAQLYEHFGAAGRRFTWIDLKTVKFMDGGWRGPIDYGRFTLAVEQFAAMVKADIYPLSVSGENCRYCEFRGVCGGLGIAGEDHGKPGSSA